MKKSKNILIKPANIIFPLSFLFHFLHPSMGDNIKPQPHVIILHIPQHLLQHINYGAIHFKISLVDKNGSLGSNSFISSIFTTFSN